MAELGKASAETKKAASHAGPAPASFETGLGDVEIREGEAKSPDIASRHAALLSDPRLISRFSPQQRVRLVQHIQRGYGNGHVARVMSQLQSTAPASHSALASATDHDSGPVQRQPAAAAPPSAGPENDPHFKEVVEKIHQVGAKEKRHGPPAAKAAEAQKAAVPPSNDTASQAAAAQVDTMNQQKPGAFDKQAFMNAVRKAIEAAAPSNLDQAEKYKQSGKAEAVKAQVSGLTEKGKEGAQKDIKSAAEAPPDASKAKPKAVTPMNPEDPGQPPAGVGADRALPPPASADQVNLDAGPAQVKDTLAAANVTDQQLANSNEPQFQGALAAKQKVEENAKEAPKQYRQDEQTTLSASKAEAVTAAAQHLGAMHAHRAGTHAHVGAGKSHAKAGDEAKRAEFATKIEGIYTRAKTDVTKILGDLDKSVEKAFDDGEKAARSAFETYIEEKTHQFKVDRYLKGAFGPEKWIIDQFKSPPELNQIVEDGRKLYLKQMDGVISRVADVVGNGLTQAKQRIAQGRQEIQKFIGDQPKELQKIAREAAQDFEGKFNQLSQDVDNKQGELVNTLAQKYLSARDALDKRVAELKDANKSLTDQAVDFAKGVVDTIKGLKDMLLNVLAKAQAAIDKIIADPIGFLGNLVSAVKQGLNQFVANIGTHLKKGLLGWLFGALADAGIQLPETFDLKGILSLVLQVLGLSWANIRSRAAKLLGEPVVAKLEQVFDVFKTIATEGLGGLLKFVQEKFVELKDGVISAIKDWVITKVITAGITWLISMLNPASAFIKACKAIYDVVMFFIERGSQIMSLVNAILDGVIAIANGSLGGAANLVEEALGKAVPVAISFLASLLGLGGISEQIKKVIQTIQAPINKLIDTVIGGAAKYAKKFLGPLLAKVKGGVAKVKQKAGQAKDWVVGKAKAAGGAVKEKLGIGGPGETEQSVQVKAKAHHMLTERTKQPFKTVTDLKAAVDGVLGGLRPEGLKALRLEPDSRAPGKYTIFAEASPPTPVDEAQVVTADIIPPQRYLPPVLLRKGEIRKRLYIRGSGWGSVRTKVNAWAVNEFMPMIDMIKSGYLSKKEGREALQTHINEGLLPATALDAFERGQLSSQWIEANVNYHVDHKESLAEHWVSKGGNDCGDAARHSAATDLSNLRWITDEANLAKGSKNQDGEGSSHFTDKPWVGPNFISAIADDGKLGAKEIDGVRFLDDKGNSIP